MFIVIYPTLSFSCFQLSCSTFFSFFSTPKNDKLCYDETKSPHSPMSRMHKEIICQVTKIRDFGKLSPHFLFFSSSCVKWEMKNEKLIVFFSERKNVCCCVAWGWSSNEEISKNRFPANSCPFSDLITNPIKLDNNSIPLMENLGKILSLMTIH